MLITPEMGVRLGKLDLHDRSAGVGFKTAAVDNWWSPTASTGVLYQDPAGSGGWAGEAFSAGRRLVLAGSLRGRDRAHALELVQALNSALTVDRATPLVVRDEDGPWFAMVRQEDRPDYVWLTDTHATFNIQLHSEEWRLLAGDGTGPAHRQTVGLPSTIGGRRRPFRLPSAIGAAVVSGSVTVSNRGDAPAAVVLEFTGPVPHPTVRMPDGQWLAFDLEVLEGQTLVVDLDAPSALLNGVPRVSRKRGEWLRLGPGDNILTFDSAAYSDAATMTVLWSDARK